MTLQRSGGAAAFSESASAYAETMAPALLPVAREVVRRASLRREERVLDVGTGTGSAAAMAVGEGRTVIGLDAAAGMLDLARRTVAGVEFVQADFLEIPRGDASVDVVLAVHALLFADDRVAALREWRRVTKAHGRLSLSVPGPDSAVPNTLFGPVFDRHGIRWGNDYPTEPEIAAWAAEAGWSSIETAADPTITIPLADDAQFRTWLSVGARGRATAGWTRTRRRQLEDDLMEAARETSRAGFRLPFGTLYLTARNDG